MNSTIPSIHPAVLVALAAELGKGASTNCVVGLGVGGRVIGAALVGLIV
jgi:hypothetical protein